jgi:UDP-N-acetylglucosamine 2-epimerase (non-hydrolysing)
MDTRRVTLIFGTRPEAIKMAPLVAALRRTPWVDPVVAVTGQHRHILDQVLDLFGIAPDHDLDILRSGQTLAEVTERALRGLTRVLAAAAPDMVVVQGDTTTTFVGALAAFYAGTPVAHLEAGLRTGDLRQPFPEECNRRLTSQIAALHLAPTPQSRINLLREGFDPAGIVVTGNTVIDALHWTVSRQVAYGDAALEELDADPRPVLLVTAHRRESWGAGMRGIGRALRRLARLEPDLRIVFPIHPNPLVREAIGALVHGCAGVRLIEPLPYGQFARLMNRASIVLTDSGGVQEEAPALGKPVLVMRDVTERPEAIHAGTARLVGTDEHRIVGAVRSLLHDPVAYAGMANAINPYGDGRACERAIAAIARYFDAPVAPDEFDPGGRAMADATPVAAAALTAAEGRPV